MTLISAMNFAQKVNVVLRFLPRQQNAQNAHRTRVILVLDIEEDNLERCAICLCDRIPAHKIVTTQCQHSFCEPCFAQWLLKSHHCPTCRAVFKDLYVRNDVDYQDLQQKL